MKKFFLLLAFGICTFVVALVQAQPIITSFEEKDLELFSSMNGSHDGFYSKLDRTCTSIGRQQLKKQLACPTTDIQELQKRQALISWFVQHPEELQRLQSYLKDFELFSYGLLPNQQFDTLTQEILKGFYYKLSFVESLNKSPLALDILNLMHGASLLSPVLEHLILHFALEFIQEKLAHRHCHHNHHHAHNCLGHLEADHDASMLVKGLFWGVRVAHLGIHLLSVKEMIEHIKARLAVVNCLYKKIAASAYALKALHNIFNMIQTNTELSELFDASSQIFLINDVNNNAELQEFITLTRDDYFELDNELGWFSSVGITLRAHQLMNSVLEQLAPAVHAIAQLDVYASCATLYQELVPQDACCFVQFIDQQEPYLEVVNGWNMMLAPEQAVPSLITCGPAGAVSKMILTGPNKSGKSTFMKGIALNILLAQTLGICAAQKFILKPFDQIITYINIADDIANNQSKFVAEIMRADQCIARLKSLKKTQSAFVLIDDSLFSGTNPDLGQRAAYDFIGQLAQFDNSIAFVATHLPILTTLEAVYPSIFKNYKIKLNTDEFGIVNSTFMLEPGISGSSEAFILL